LSGHGLLTQEDPIGLAGGLNLYGYANGDPVNFSDPFGLCPIPPSNCLDVAMAAVSVGAFIAAPSVGTAIDAALDVAGALPGVLSVGVLRRAFGAADEVVDGARALQSAGRTGKQARLRELATDPDLGSADKGWIQQEMNSIERGQRSTIRNPPGKDLAHRRGYEARKGYSYKHSDLQDRSLHRLQHKHEGYRE
jgi:uncharacterized protein RhaS with RHS repeats